MQVIICATVTEAVLEENFGISHWNILLQLSSNFQRKHFPFHPHERNRKIESTHSS